MTPELLWLSKRNEFIMKEIQ